MKQKLIELKGEIDKHTIIVEDLNTALSALDRTRKKINKSGEDVKNAINLLDLIGIYRTLPKTKECTFFSNELKVLRQSLIWP